MTSKSLYGTTLVTVGDTEYELKPTLAAVRKIEHQYGGLRPALEALSGLSVDATALVIAAGAALSPKETRELAEAVFSEGVADVSAQAVSFIVTLLNPGGSNADTDTDEDTPGKPKKKAS